MKIVEKFYMLLVVRNYVVCTCLIEEDIVPDKCLSCFLRVGKMLLLTLRKKAELM